MQLLDIAQAEVEAEVPATRATDDRPRITVFMLERFRPLHAQILRHPLANVTELSRHSPHPRALIVECLLRSLRVSSGGFTTRWRIQPERRDQPACHQGSASVENVVRVAVLEEPSAEDST